MTLYSTTTKFGSAASDAFATVGRDARVSVDQASLIVVMLFAAIGLLLTATFFTTGSLAEFGQILAAAS
jgi:hypothetical protein